jgi:hypothetical protein
VGRDNEDMLNWATTEKYFDDKRAEVVEAINYCWDKQNINQAGPAIYKKAIENLAGIIILRNEFDVDSIDVESIPLDVKARLRSGIAALDLLQVSHIGLISKI